MAGEVLSRDIYEKKDYKDKEIDKLTLDQTKDALEALQNYCKDKKGLEERVEEDLKELGLLQAHIIKLQEWSSQTSTDTSEQKSTFENTDVSAATTYLAWLKTKSWSEVSQEGSNWVRAVQIVLNNKIGANLEVDWDLGTKNSKTRAAVIKFQEKWNAAHSDNKIAVDGVPWPITIKAILDEYPSDAAKTEGSGQGVENSEGKIENSKNWQERLEKAENKYWPLPSFIDWKSDDYFKQGVLGEDKTLSMWWASYKKVESGNTTYNGLGYRVAKTEDWKYNYVEIWEYQNGKCSGLWARFFDDGEKQFGDFKDGKKDWYIHIYYSEKDSEKTKEYIWQMKNLNYEWQWKKIMKDGKIYEWEFKDHKFQWKGPTNVKEGMPWFDPETWETSGFSETVWDRKTYEWDKIKEQKINAEWLKNNKETVAQTNDYTKGKVLKGTTYKLDWSMETITIWVKEDVRLSEALSSTNMDKKVRWTCIVTENLDESGKNWEMRVCSWNREIGIKVENWVYRFQTPQWMNGWMNELWRGFTSKEDAILAADLINFWVRGTDDRINNHSDEKFDRFETDGSGIDLDTHGNGTDTTWINSDVSKYFAWTSKEQIARWMTDYYRWIKKIK